MSIWQAVSQCVKHCVFPHSQTCLPASHPGSFSSNWTRGPSLNTLDHFTARRPCSCSPSHEHQIHQQPPRHHSTGSPPKLYQDLLQGWAAIRETQIRTPMTHLSDWLKQTRGRRTNVSEDTETLNHTCTARGNIRMAQPLRESLVVS